MLKRKICSESATEAGLQLQMAIKKARFPKIKVILNKIQNIDRTIIRDSLYTVIHSGPHMSKTAEALLNYGYIVNRKDVKDATFLHGAVHMGSATIVKLLLERGADVSVRDEDGRLAIDYAIQKNDVGITKVLWRWTNFSSKEKVARLFFGRAMIRRYSEIVEIFLNRTPWLVNSRDNYGNTPLHFAAEDGRDEVIDVLLGKGANVNAVSKDGTSPLHLAAKAGHVDIVRVLLANKADVEALGEHLSTPLHLAVLRGNLAVVTMLLNHGANINAKRCNGDTVLHLAYADSSGRMVSLLVSRNARVDARNNNKSTPLHVAIGQWRLEVLRRLLELGVDVEARDNCGKTALHIAARRGSSGEIAVLLNHGADVNVLCKESMTPLEHAHLRVNFRFNWDHVLTLNYHVISLMASGHYVSNKNRKLAQSDDIYWKLLQVCREEVKNMRTTKIGDSNITVYDVLTVNMHKLASYWTRNESIIEALETKDLGYNFTMYSKIIDHRIREGQLRIKLLNPCLKSLITLSGYDLPDPCAHELFNYLSNTDMKSLINAAQIAAAH